MALSADVLMRSFDFSVTLLYHFINGPRLELLGPDVYSTNPLTLLVYDSISSTHISALHVGAVRKARYFISLYISATCDYTVGRGF